MSNRSQIFSDEALLQRVRENGAIHVGTPESSKAGTGGGSESASQKRQRSFSPPQKALIAARVAANDRF